MAIIPILSAKNYASSKCCVVIMIVLSLNFKFTKISNIALLATIYDLFNNKIYKKKIFKYIYLFIKLY